MAPMSPKYVSARRPHRDRGEKAPEYPREVPKQKAKSAAIEKTEFLAEECPPNERNYYSLSII
jgi:hypothetical protein